MLKDSDNGPAGPTAWNLILQTCCHTVEAGFDEIRTGRLSDRNFRTSFLALARQHAVLGLTLAAIQRSAVFPRLAPDVRGEFLGELKRRRRRTALWLIERDRILSLLAHHDLDPIVLKGAALCTTAYREPAEREFIDLDLLIEREAVGTAVDILATEGYRFKRSVAAKEDYLDHHFHLPLHDSRGLAIEIHWGLTRPGRPFRLDPAAFISGSVKNRGLDSVRLRMPRQEHLLLHVVDQNIQENFARLSRFVDIDRIVRAWPSLNWTRLRAEARRGEMQHALSLSLQLSCRLLQTPVPREVLENLQPSPLVRFHLGLLQPEDSLRRQTFGRRWAASQLLNLCLQTRGRGRLKLLWDVMSGSPDPMWWIWVGGTRHARRRKSFAGVRTLAKLIGFQVLLYVSALVGVLTRARAADGLWRAGSSP